MNVELMLAAWHGAAQAHERALRAVAESRLLREDLRRQRLVRCAQDDERQPDQVRTPPPVSIY